MASWVMIEVPANSALDEDLQMLKRRVGDNLEGFQSRRKTIGMEVVLVDDIINLDFHRSSRSSNGIWSSSWLRCYG